jgi:hypothetical protein
VKCFRHREVDAIGICKSCQRGLCGDCVEIVDRGLACRESCVEDVRRIGRIVDASEASLSRSPEAYRRVAQSYRFTSLWLAIACVGTAVAGALAPRIRDVLSWSAVFFGLGAGLFAVQARRWGSLARAAERTALAGAGTTRST